MAIITVTSSADSGAGSLRAAIASAQDGDTIKFASNLTNQTVTLTSGQLEIPSGKNLILDGADAPGLALSGNNASRILYLNSTSVTPTSLTVKNLALVNGYTPERGGAISTTHQGRLTVENVVFENNVADHGGGAIFSAYEGTLSVTGSQFRNNKAIAANDERGAGAIAFWGPGECTVRNSDFTNNQGINGGAINSLNGKLTIMTSRFINNDTTAAVYDAGEANPSLRGLGGAVYTDRASAVDEASGTIRIVNSVFEGNRGRGEGGAAYLYTGGQDTVIIDGTLFQDNEVLPLPNGGNAGNGGAIVQMSNETNRGFFLTDSAIINNTAPNQGGGLWVMGAPTTIANSTFSGNIVTGNASSNVGGAMTLYAPATITNATIAYNHAGWVGGGISVGGGETVTVQNTIFANNTADNGGNNWNIQQHTNGYLTDRGGNIQYPPVSQTGSDYRVTPNVILGDPKLGSLQDSGSGLPTHALLQGSLAINAGVSNGAPDTDQRGYDRDAQPDIGAFEFGARDDGGDDGGDPILGVTRRGDGQNNRLQGTQRNDLLVGKGGDDRLLGGEGDDRLVGGKGNDRLLGGGGNDQITSGAGRDRMVFQSIGDARDRITDFNPKQDVLDLDTIIQGRSFSSRRPFRDYIQLVQSGAHTRVNVDANGDQVGGFQTLAILENTNADRLHADNFLL